MNTATAGSQCKILLDQVVVICAQDLHFDQRKLPMLEAARDGLVHAADRGNMLPTDLVHATLILLANVLGAYTAPQDANETVDSYVNQFVAYLTTAFALPPLQVTLSPLIDHTGIIYTPLSAVKH